MERRWTRETWVEHWSQKVLLASRSPCPRVIESHIVEHLLQLRWCDTQEPLTREERVDWLRTLAIRQSVSLRVDEGARGFDKHGSIEHELNYSAMVAKMVADVKARSSR